MRRRRAVKRPAGVNVVIALGIFGFLALTAYWCAWFWAPELVRARTPGDPEYDVYMAYEQAFPLPDAFVALALLAGSIGLVRMRDWGLLSMLLGLGGIIFLGLEDLLFDLQHEMFSPFSGEAAIELAIVILIVAFGPLATVLLWRHRRELIR
jgi:hypothetical protein